MEFEFPGRDRLESTSDVELSDLPRAYRVSRVRDQPTVPDVTAATLAAVDEVPTLDELEPGSTVGITAGSRGIEDLPAVLEALVSELQSRGLEPFVFPAMGSHGGATPEGQRETLATLGITPDRLGCDVESSLAVERVGSDSTGRPVYAAEDALDADAVLLVNRIKRHTDFEGDVESGLCKMAVVGLGKQRGADGMHDAAIDRGFADVIPEWAGILVEETPIVGGVGIVENAEERAAEIRGVPATDLLEVEPELLARSRELFPELPVDDLDLLVVDEMGKEISGTGLDTNVVGRVRFQGQVELDEPSLSRVYVRSLTPASHGNALGVGLADLVHRDLASAVDFGDTYVNIVTSGEPSRANLPFVVPSDATAFVLSASMTGVASAGELRIARIENTLTPGNCGCPSRSPRNSPTGTTSASTGIDPGRSTSTANSTWVASVMPHPGVELRHGALEAVTDPARGELTNRPVPHARRCRVRCIDERSAVRGHAPPRRRRSRADLELG